MDAAPTNVIGSADDRMIQLWRKLDDADRFLIANHVNTEVRRALTELLRQHNPDATDDELRCRLAAVLYGRELASKAYGLDPGEPAL